MGKKLTFSRFVEGIGDLEFRYPSTSIRASIKVLKSALLKDEKSEDEAAQNLAAMIATLKISIASGPSGFAIEDVLDLEIFQRVYEAYSGAVAELQSLSMRT